jgi:Asp/Glu/hydantoin racemase
LKTLALIHTSPVLTPMFAGLAKELLGDTPVFHMVDESLIANTIRSGGLQKDTIRRVVNHVDSAARAGADVVLVTCSSIGPAVNVARQLFDFPVLRIDEAMAERAVHTGSRVGVIATLSTTLDPTVNLIRDTAARLGRAVEVASHLCEGAFQAVISGDTATHDRAVTEGLRKLAGEVDVIVLAQASMARVVDQLAPGELTVPVLSSPRLAMERARDVLAG